jgi:hypothetical protein
VKEPIKTSFAIEKFPLTVEAIEDRYGVAMGSKASLIGGSVSLSLLDMMMESRYGYE